MSVLVTNFLAAFLLPPLNFLILGAIGLILLDRKPRIGKRLITAMLVLFWIFSLRVVGDSLLALLERDAHTPVEQLRSAQAIVVLAGGSDANAPDYGGQTVNWATLERLRLASSIYHQIRLPILVTGGNPDGNTFPDAVLMKRTLEDEFDVPVHWVESTSENTRQNATNSFQLLADIHVQTIVLVTHGWHMPRARRIFERAGFRVLPAGTSFHNDDKLKYLNFLPSTTGLNNSGIFLHEAVGLLWYRLLPLKQSTH
jgi:uncharacterized SAM-binding protein YcdF (DUF218 family)